MHHARPYTSAYIHTRLNHTTHPAQPLTTHTAHNTQHHTTPIREMRVRGGGVSHLVYLVPTVAALDFFNSPPWDIVLWIRAAGFEFFSTTFLTLLMLVLRGI
jgi:hypothetical protein